MKEKADQPVRSVKVPAEVWRQAKMHAAKTGLKLQAIMAFALESYLRSKGQK